MTRQDGPHGLDHPHRPVVVGVDVGGTKILAGRVCPDTGEVSGLVERPTPTPEQGEQALEGALVDAVSEARAGIALAAVGLGAAGFVDTSGEKVRFAPHLAWRERDVRSIVAGRLGVPVILENDASCAAVGECRYGAGRGASSVVMVTVGTGIGGGTVIDGQLVRGANGMAGEFGHTRVVTDGRLCQCGLRGCWEQYCSGPALVGRAREGMATRSSLLSELTGGRPDLVTGPLVGRAAADGDPVSIAAFEAVGEWLGVGLANLVAILDPELVVIGGGVGQAGERLLDPARRSLDRQLVGSSHRQAPRVVAASLGAAACVVGAAALAHDQA